MIITYLGEHYMKFQVGDLTIAVNPPSKVVQPKPVKFSADIIMSAINDNDLVDFELNQGSTNDGPLIIKGPGEYETNGLTIKGLGYKYTKDNKDYHATAFAFELDGIKVGIISYLDSKDNINEEVQDLLGSVEILTVPLGTGLSPAGVYQIAKSFTPNIIIPTGAVNDKIVAKVFADEASQSANHQDKLTVKAKDLIGKEAEIIFLN